MDKWLGDDCCLETAVHADNLATVRDTLPADDALMDLAEVFKVFGDSTRVKILYALYECELCVCDIAQLFNLSQSAISHQLAILKSSKLVKSRRDGKSVFYSLADDHVILILTQGMAHVTE